MTEQQTITELQASATKIDAHGWQLQLWPNGIYFVESPRGEGAQVPEEAVSGALANLLRIFF